MNHSVSRSSHLEENPASLHLRKSTKRQLFKVGLNKVRVYFHWYTIRYTFYTHYHIWTPGTHTRARTHKTQVHVHTFVRRISFFKTRYFHLLDFFSYRRKELIHGKSVWLESLLKWKIKRKLPSVLYWVFQLYKYKFWNTSNYQETSRVSILKQTDRLTDRQYRQTYRQTDGQTYTTDKTDRQTDRQTDRHTDRQKQTNIQKLIRKDR